jgi:hypothetical protein
LLSAERGTAATGATASACFSQLVKSTPQLSRAMEKREADKRFISVEVRLSGNEYFFIKYTNFYK